MTFVGTGTYILALRLWAPCERPVGRLGPVALAAGWYLYVGSAMGPGGLYARLARHRRQQWSGKRLHWHIDYVRECAQWAGAWVRPSGECLECEWASALRALPTARVVAPGLGASDCGCPSHLVWAPALPDDGWFSAVLGAERMTVAVGRAEELLEILTVGEESAREEAALALGALGAEAVEPLAALLAQGEPQARWWAARALAEIDDEGVVPPLAAALQDGDPDVRACAALALGRVGRPGGASALAHSLTDPSALVAAIAADALSMIGEPAVEALVGMMQDGAHPQARLLAVRALSRIQAQPSVGPLLEALDDPSYLVRYYAREALDALGVGMVYFSA